MAIGEHIVWCHSSQPFRSQTTSLPGANRSIGPWSSRSRPFRSLELSLSRAKWPGNFRSRGARPMSISAYRRRPSHLRVRKSQTSKVPGNEMATKRKGQGGNWKGSELARVLLADSLQGTNWPGSEKARYRRHWGRYRLLFRRLTPVHSATTPAWSCEYG